MNTPAEFNACLSTVADCSYSDSAGCSLINSSEPMVNFDEVKDVFSREVSPKKKPASADGLFVDSEGCYVLVEFKSGDVEKREVLQKAYDSAIILSDREDKSSSWVRGNVKFILVYYPEKASKDKNINSRNNLMMQGTKNSSKPILIYLNTVSNFLYDHVYEMTPEDFSNKYL